jgi:hypothetical protein
MKQSQYKNLLSGLEDALGVLPDTLPAKDISKIEEQIQNKNHIVMYDPASHGGSYELYEHFLENRDLKWIWCHSGNRYGVDPVELYRKAPDRCPVFGTLLDYGLGENASTNLDLFRPSLDHTEQQSRGGTKRGDVSNIEVMSNLANRLLNNATLMQSLYLLKYALKNKG